MWVVLVAAYTVLAVSLHGVVRRAAPDINSVVVFAIVGAGVGIALIAHLLLLHLPASEMWAVLVLYALACELYTFLFTLVMTSVSVGLLLALRNGSIVEADLAERSDPRVMVRVRIERLVASGLLRNDSGNLAPTARGRRLVWIFGVLGSVFRHRQSITSG
jgi:hypothetical protein